MTSPTTVKILYGIIVIVVGITTYLLILATTGNFEKIKQASGCIIISRDVNTDNSCELFNNDERNMSDEDLCYEYGLEIYCFMNDTGSEPITGGISIHKYENNLYQLFTKIDIWYKNCHGYILPSSGKYSGTITCTLQDNSLSKDHKLLFIIISADIFLIVNMFALTWFVITSKRMEKEFSKKDYLLK
jgi:hypothetical protein